MSALKAAIGRLKGLQQVLANPVDFYAERQAEYRELARTTALMTLTNLRPDGADPGLWAQQAAAFSNRVGAGLAGVGIVLTLEEQPIVAAVDAPARFALNGLSIAQIERFVAAGRVKESADAPGKNLDERDESKSDLQIAWRIMYALRLSKPGSAGLQAAILRFGAAEQRGSMESLLPQVLKAWETVLRPKAKADFQAWVHRNVAANA